MYKECKKCNKMKLFSEMKKHKNRKDSIDSICLVCNDKFRTAASETSKGLAQLWFRHRFSECKKRNGKLPIGVSSLEELNSHRLLFEKRWSSKIEEFKNKYPGTKVKVLYFKKEYSIEDDDFYVPRNKTLEKCVSPTLEEYVPPRFDEKFIPSKVDNRRKSSRKISKRDRRFRKMLFNIHGKRCMITGCKTLVIVDACHVHGRSSDSDDHWSNGVLLKKDIHGLYDNDMIAIHPDTKKIHILPSVLKENPYLEEYENCVLKYNPKYKIDNDSLVIRWEKYLKKLCDEKSPAQ